MDLPPLDTAATERSSINDVRILVIEDDPHIGEAVETALRADGFAVDRTATYDDAEVAASVNTYDAVVADRSVPGGDTIDLVRAWRELGNPTPVLFLTARDSVADRVAGFEVGGDDYLVKPFALDELVVRVRSLCRRRSSDAPAILNVGDLEINRARAEVRRGGVLLPLTGKERCILILLSDRAGDAVSRSELIEHCWDETHDPMSNVCDVHVGSLRRKLGSPNPITTVRGVGFMLEL